MVRNMEGLNKAIGILGSQQKLAEACNVKQQHVSYWLKNRVPAERVAVIVHATQNQVTPHDLRPDLYPAEYNFLSISSLSEQEKLKVSDKVDA